MNDEYDKPDAVEDPTIPAEQLDDEPDCDCVEPDPGSAHTFGESL